MPAAGPTLELQAQRLKAPGHKSRLSIVRVVVHPPPAAPPTTSTSGRADQVALGLGCTDPERATRPADFIASLILSARKSQQGSRIPAGDTGKPAGTGPQVLEAP